jgi:CxC5 like cysteine cluster associated with KDZ transposases
MKLDELAVVLNLIPKKKKAPKSKLIPISQKEIQPVLVICPRSTICEDMTCSARSLVQGTKLSNIPKVTLIKGTMIYKNVPLLTGQCPKCSTLYSADHE